MHKLVLLIVLNSILTIAGYSQKIVRSTFLYIDEPDQTDKDIIKTNYRIIKFFSCSDSVFKESDCACTKIQFYNDSGKITKLIAGKNLAKNQVDYNVKYKTINDSTYEGLIEFYSGYVDSISPFMIDTIIKGKSKRIEVCPREKNRNLVIKSIYKYELGASYPKQILRYDKAGILREICYPLGNRKVLKEGYDTIATELDTTIYYNISYVENSLQTYRKFTKSGILLERGEIYTDHKDTYTRKQKSIYIYDDSSNLVFIHTYDDKNVFIQTESYKYINGKLSTYSIDRNLSDSVDNEIKKYNSSGKLIEYSERERYNPHDTWKWSYFYKGNIQIRTDYFRNNEYEGSTLFLYE